MERERRGRREAAERQRREAEVRGIPAHRFGRAAAEVGLPSNSPSPPPLCAVGPSVSARHEAWREMVAMQQEGLIRHAGAPRLGTEARVALPHARSRGQAHRRLQLWHGGATRAQGLLPRRAARHAAVQVLPLPPRPHRQRRRRGLPRGDCGARRRPHRLLPAQRLAEQAQGGGGAARPAALEPSQNLLGAFPQAVEDAHVRAIAARAGKTPAQVCLRWGERLGLDTSVRHVQDMPRRSSSAGASSSA